MKKNESIVNNEEFLNQCGFSAEEIEMLKDADAIAETAKLIPDDADKFIDKILKDFPDDKDACWKKLGEVIEKDPKFYAQLVALNEVSNTVSFEEAPKIEKLSTEQLKEGSNKELLTSILEKAGYKK